MSVHLENRLKMAEAYPRQNGLALALREVGRIERPIFMLDWLRDLDLRRRTQAGLNKGEARNVLARALFFNQLGELRDRRFENQTYRASGLNLLVAAIILWNTRYLERAVGPLAIPEDVARHIAPLGWEHISLTGDYRWNVESRPDPGQTGGVSGEHVILAGEDADDVGAALHLIVQLFQRVGEAAFPAERCSKRYTRT